MNSKFAVKNERIKASMKATHEKRKSQTCKVIMLKIHMSKLSPLQCEQLKMMFVEAKWLRNSLLGWTKESEDNKIWEYKGDLKTATIKLPDGNSQTRELKYLGSQMRQSVQAELTANIRTLASLKKRGHNTGELRFKSEVTALSLKQFGMSHKWKSKHRMKLQNVTGTVYLHGVEQIPKDCDVANAKLLNTPQGYMLALTVFVDKAEEEKRTAPIYDEPIGIDMGLRTNITLSTGEKINVQIGESERLKTLQRKLARQKKRSNNWYKTKRLIEIEHQKIVNKRNDKANKIVHDLLCYSHVYFQDEDLKSWHMDKQKGWSRKVQYSCMGRVKAKLNNHARATMLNRNVPTTELCVCGRREPMKLTDRMFHCSVCGHTVDRDIHAAKNMILIGQGLSKFKPVEMMSVAYAQSSVKQEATMSLA